MARRAAEQIPEEDNFFRVAARAEPTPPATEREQILVAAVGAAHAGKTFAQITAFQITADHTCTMCGAFCAYKVMNERKAGVGG